MIDRCRPIQVGPEGIGTLIEQHPDDVLIRFTICHAGVDGRASIMVLVMDIGTGVKQQAHLVNQFLDNGLLKGRTPIIVIGVVNICTCFDQQL